MLQQSVCVCGCYTALGREGGRRLILVVTATFRIWVCLVYRPRRLLGFHPCGPQRGRPLVQGDESTSLPSILTQSSVGVSKFRWWKLFTKLAESPLPTHTASWEKMANPLCSCWALCRGPGARKSLPSSSFQTDISFNAEAVTSEKPAFVF